MSRGRKAQIGTKGNDQLNGTASRDVLIGHGGDDVLLGMEGKDKLIGQKGDDTLSGGAGNDKLLGGKGDDILQGGSGADKVKAGKGDDLMIHDLSLNQVAGMKDQYDGGQGNDTLMLMMSSSEKAALEAIGLPAAFDAAMMEDHHFHVGEFLESASPQLDFLLNIDMKHIENLILNQRIEVQDDSASTDEDTVLLASSIFANDDDGIKDDFNLLTMQVTTAQGVLVNINADGTYAYDPGSTFQHLNDGDSASDSFDYTIEVLSPLDGSVMEEQTGQVDITISGSNDAPTAAILNDQSISEDDVVDENGAAITHSILISDLIESVTDIDDATGFDLENFSAAGLSLEKSADGLSLEITTNDPATLDALESGDSAVINITADVKDSHGAVLAAQNFDLTINGAEDVVADNPDIMLLGEFFRTEYYESAYNMSLDIPKIGTEAMWIDDNGVNNGYNYSPSRNEKLDFEVERIFFYQEDESDGLTHEYSKVEYETLLDGAGTYYVEFGIDVDGNPPNIRETLNFSGAESVEIVDLSFMNHIGSSYRGDIDPNSNYSPLESKEMLSTSFSQETDILVEMNATNLARWSDNYYIEAIYKIPPPEPEAPMKLGDLFKTESVEQLAPDDNIYTRDFPLPADSEDVTWNDSIINEEALDIDVQRIYNFLTHNDGLTDEWTNEEYEAYISTHLIDNPDATFYVEFGINSQTLNGGSYISNSENLIFDNAWTLELDLNNSAWDIDLLEGVNSPQAEQTVQAGLAAFGIPTELVERDVLVEMDSSNLAKWDFDGSEYHVEAIYMDTSPAPVIPEVAVDPIGGGGF